MALIKAKDIARRVKSDGLKKTIRHLRECIKEGHLKVDDFSIRELAESLIVDADGESVGRNWVESLGPQRSGGLQLMEAASQGVSLSAFSNITGQIFFSAIMESYENQAFIATDLVTTRPTKLSGEKIPGITGITEAVEEVNPGMPYPELGFGEDYVETPVTTKRGFIISVDKETIFFDRTGLVVQRAGEVGELLALKKEKLILQLILGIVNNYKWRGTTYNTYQTATPWINVKATNGIVDWQQIDAVEQLFAEMLEPNTSEPIMITPNQILHMPARRHAFRRVINATELRRISDTAAQQTISQNTVDPYQLIESKLAYRLIQANGETATNAKDWWFMGDFKKAFEWQENWPITVVQAPSNAEAEFKQDIVLRWKASERGSAAVKNPRYVVKAYQA